jgi:hypothetical protein
VEHAGIEVSYTEKRTYAVSTWYEYEHVVASDDIFSFSWLRDAKTAVGASLKFGL